LKPKANNKRKDPPIHPPAIAPAPKRTRPSNANSVGALTRYHGPPLKPAGLDIATPSPPADKKIYRPASACKVIYSIGGGVVDNTMPTRTKRKALRLHMSQVGLVPVKDTQFKIVTAKFVNNEQLQHDWGMIGKKLKLTVDQINEITDNHLHQNQGQAITSDTYKQAYKEITAAAAIAAGAHPETVQIPSPCKKTCDKALLIARAVNGNVKAVTNTIAKSESRQIAERSIIGGLSFDLVTLNTHTHLSMPSR